MRIGDKLTARVQEAAAKHDGKVVYCVSDAGSPEDREALLDWVKANYSDCNALVNNAGIQVRMQGDAAVAVIVAMLWGLSIVF